MAALSWAGIGGLVPGALDFVSEPLLLLRTLLGVVLLALASQTFKTLLLEELHAWLEVVLAKDWCELWWLFDVKSFGELDGGGEIAHFGSAAHVPGLVAALKVTLDCVAHLWQVLAAAAIALKFLPALIGLAEEL